MRPREIIPHSDVVASSPKVIRGTATSVWLSIDEYLKLKKLANRYRMTMSEFLRRKALDDWSGVKGKKWRRGR